MAVKYDKLFKELKRRNMKDIGKNLLETRFSDSETNQTTMILDTSISESFII